ncbi:MAG: hypothetical protein PGN23_02170 [Sphingomonas adhaesiva]|uniref:hypothetical protein n=1 Tax=Sphingomonas adhaesiva TaxID=28212 RepID=UPI002FF61EC5
MTDFSGTPRGPSRPRIGPVLAIAIVAFVIGLGLMAYAVRNTPGFFVRSGTPSPTPSPAAAPTLAAAAAGSADLDTLALREAALAAQIANLEARVARTDGDSAQAAARAGRAEAILTAFAARRAIDRGAGLGYLEAQLRERFGPTLPNDVNAVIRAARAPVTLEDLREGLNGAAPVLLSQRSDWWAGIGSELRSLIVIHRAGTPSPLPSDRLARARRMIDMGNVDGALGEVRRLPGAGDADGWIAAARRWIAARRALDTLEAAAITGAIAPPRVMGAPAMPAPAPSPSAEPEDQGLF